MYIPKFNHVSDRALLIEAMRTWSFATLYGPDEQGASSASHLPLVVKDEGEHGVLEGHFARANGHWKGLAGHGTLVVFTGPHSYVSPALYSNPKSVPTWNYIAVHATGTLELIGESGEDEAANLAAREGVVKDLIAVHEPRYADQWSELPEHYRTGMLHGIVGFRLIIECIEGKFKLSQNRPEIDRRSIQAAHAAGTPEQELLAAWMLRLEEQGK